MKLADPLLSFFKTMKKERDGLLICDLQKRSLTINKKVINLPPSEFILYLNYLINKTSGCKHKNRSSCNNCEACFETFRQTVTPNRKLMDLYKQIYGENSDNYQMLKTKSKNEPLESPQGFLQKISKINRKIKSKLKCNATPYCISGSGNYGCTVYGIKLDSNKISILNHEK